MKTNIALICAAIAANATASQITDLGPGYAIAVNDREQVITAGGLWSNGHIYTLSGFHAESINNSGTLCGSAVGTDGIEYPATFNTKGSRNVVTMLGTFGGQRFGQAGLATAINNYGQVVGWAYTPNEVQHAFATPFHDIGDFTALDINDFGTIVGTNGHAVLLESGGHLQELFNVQSEARAVNNTGSITGEYQSNGVTQGFVYVKGTVTTIPNCSPFDINDDERVVGTFWVQPESCGPTCDLVPRAFMWQNGIFTDLSERFAGWSLEYAFAVNNKGHIVGIGETNGESHGYLIEP